MNTEEQQLLETVKSEVAKTVEAKMKEKGMTAEQVNTAVAEAMKKYEDIDPTKLKDLFADFEVVKNEIPKMKNDMRKGNSTVSIKEMIAEAFTDEQKWKDVQDVVRRKSGVVELFTTKAVGNVTTGSVTTDTGGNALLDLIKADDLRSLNIRDPFIEEFATVTRTSQAVYSYADYQPKEGDVTFVGEGGQKPQIDLKVTVEHQTAKKAAGYIIQTDEAWQDMPRLESEARTLLLRKYLLRRQNGILFGTGLANDPVGVTEIASAYNPVIAGLSPNTSADNLKDAIIAASVQIYNTINYADEVQYMPNVAFVNPADLAGLKLMRTDHGYLFPEIAVTANSANIGGFPIVGKSEIPVGKLLIGDFTQLNIINYIDYTVSLGWINDQFIKNLFTMIGEGRFFSFVRTLDQRAFIYDDIANILNGIRNGGGSGSGS